MADLPTDPHQNALFREIEEDLRRDHILRLWKRYGVYVIATVILIIAIVAGYQGWMIWGARQQAAEALRYEQAETLIRDDKVDEAVTALMTLAAESSTGYRSLARLTAASLLKQKGRVDESASLYKSLIDDPKADPALRDLARISYVLCSLDLPEATLDELLSVLAPLFNPANTYHPAALEARAMIALQQGNLAAARDDLSSLALMTNIPPDMRTRAEEMLTQIPMPIDSSGTGGPVQLPIVPPQP